MNSNIKEKLQTGPADYQTLRNKLFLCPRFVGKHLPNAPLVEPELLHRLPAFKTSLLCTAHRRSSGGIQPLDPDSEEDEEEPRVQESE